MLNNMVDRILAYQFQEINVIFKIIELLKKWMQTNFAKKMGYFIYLRVNFLETSATSGFNI